MKSRGDNHLRGVLLSVCIGLVCVGAAGSVAARGREQPQAGPGQPNIVLISIDSMRADHLGAYDYEPSTTPRLDALATRSLLFTRAHATSAWTFPGLVSLFTGLYPARHGYLARGHVIAEVPTLQSILARSGYRVPNLSHVSSVPGMGRLDLEPPWRAPDGSSSRGDLVKWLQSPEAQQRPFLAWAHRRELHLPYGPGNRPDAVAASPGLAQVRRFGVIPARLQSFTPTEQSEIADLYDADLRQVDEWVGTVVETLEQTGLADHTILVVTADHGEELFDHGLLGHASTNEHAQLYEEVVRIPLLVHLPAGTAARIDCPASQIDLLPTLLRILHIASPERLDGRVLWSDGGGTDCPTRPLFIESIQGGFQAHDESARNYLWAVIENGWKLIVRRDDRGDESGQLYDLGADPFERFDRFDAGSSRGEQMLSILREYQADQGGVDYWQRPFDRTPLAGRRPEAPASAPVILAPGDGAVIYYARADGSLTGRWSGSPTASYVVEYDIGEGFLRTRGSFTVVGNSYTYGPAPEDVWTTLTQFNPWRIRVLPAGAPEKASAWIAFELAPIER